MQLERLYRHRFDEASLGPKRAIWQVLCEDFFSRYIRPTDTVVDVGAGYCEFINAIPAARKIAVDENPRTAQLAGPGVEVLRERCTALSSLPDGTVDAVFMSNFLEHLPNKQVVLDTLAEARRILRPAGRLLILQPNVRLIPGEYWDFFDHHTALTENSLVEAAALIDMDVDLVIPRFLPYTTKSRLPQGPWMVRLYLRCPWAWFWLGKQSFLVLRKPS